jgi:glycosyltransferase involved in cell wall biosynthesis
LTVIVPTVGRETLRETLRSIGPQLSNIDEVLVVGDGVQSRAKEILEECLLPHARYMEIARSGDCGNSARDAAMTVACCDYLTFMDDDDVYTATAFAAIRARLSSGPNRPLIFRMNNYGNILWNTPALRYGNVGTPMFVVPNRPNSGTQWSHGVSDFDFICQEATRSGEPIWVPEVIAVVRPHLRT